MRNILKAFVLSAAFLATFSAEGLNVIIKNQSPQNAFIEVTGESISINPSIPDKKTPIPPGNQINFDLISIFAGRFNISLDKPLKTNAPDGANPTDPDYETRFDKVEITYVGGQGAANLTAVDFYGIPFQLQTLIQGTVIDNFTLAKNTTSNDLKRKLRTIAKFPNKNTIISKDGGFLRILSPVKSPGGYRKFDRLLKDLIETPTTFVITGTFFGSPPAEYNYKGFIDNSGITLKEGVNTIFIPLETLEWDEFDSLNHNAIYTCNGPYFVNGNPAHVGDNNIFSAVYRDLITGFNCGFVRPGENNSSEWFADNPNFVPFDVRPCNLYAKKIYKRYGAYGFPFSDRVQHTLADLNNQIDTVIVTVLGDNEVVPPIQREGNMNPQTGIVNYNLIITSQNPNFDGSSIQFNEHSYTGGTNYIFPSTVISTSSGSSQINQVPAQEGLNIYDLSVGGNNFQVLVQVTNGALVWGALADGGNSNFSGINLFVGGVF